MAKPGEFNQPIGNPIERKFDGEVGVLVGTGPSLTIKQLNFIDEMRAMNKCRIFAVNNAYQIIPESDVIIACNHDWWEWYWPRDESLRNNPATKYTWYKAIADEYKINYVKAIVKDGLSLDPKIIHINHGSGPMGINLALHYGIKKLLLIGHDMKFDSKYDGRKKKVGDTPRHYFGEYPKALQHWPSVKIGLSKPGVIDGLIEAYDKMPPDLATAGMEVINCTPGSALQTFPMSTLDEQL